MTGCSVVRPIAPGDADALVAFHEALDAESQYLRFFTAHPHLTPSEVERFTQVDHRDREALVVTDGRRIVAVGRYDRIDGGPSAEVAFIVLPGHRHHGLATALLDDLAVRARPLGITSFVAETLGCNHGMREVFGHSRYPTSTRFADGAVETTMEIHHADP